MARFQIVGDSAESITLATTSVIPVVSGVTTGTGDATAVMTTLADLSTFFLTIDGPFTTTTATATPSAYTATTFTGLASTVSGATLMGFGTTGDVTLKNRAGTDVLVVTANTLNVTLAGQVNFVTKAVSVTALATPTALAATALNAFASTVSGAVLMGYGTTGDVTLKNRAGTDVVVITANTTGVTMAGALAMTGALSGVTTLAASGVVTLTDATDSTSATTGSVKLTGGLGVAKALFVGTSINSVSPTAGIGYATGAGGAQTQATNKQTTVVSNTITTAITMNNEALNLLTITAFTFTNSAIAATDTVICTHESAGTSGAYTVNAFPGAGSAVISVRNNTAGSLGEAIVLRVTVVKSVSA